MKIKIGDIIEFKILKTLFIYDEEDTKLIMITKIHNDCVYKYQGLEIGNSDNVWFTTEDSILRKRNKDKIMAERI